MAAFLLVHGAWHGSWCWREIKARLEEWGHHVTAIDLPGHGEDRTPLATLTLPDYVNRVIQAVTLSTHRPIVVGHSMGGVISQAAEAVPDSMAALVYLAAVLPPNGCSMMQLVDGLDPRWLAQFEWAPDLRSAQMGLEAAKEFLYPCCPPEIVEAAHARFTPEPVAPFETPLSLTEANFGRVPRYYIECLQDRVVPIALQRSMRAGIRFDGVYSIDTDHSPFFSAPEELGAILHRIAETV